MEKTLDFKRRECRELIPITDLNAIESLCSLYDALATPEVRFASHVMTHTHRHTHARYRYHTDHLRA